jgi:hypothetical protein
MAILRGRARLQAWVIVPMGRYGHEFLETVADGDQRDNLPGPAECH